MSPAGKTHQQRSAKSESFLDRFLDEPPQELKTPFVFIPFYCRTEGFVIWGSDRGLFFNIFFKIPFLSCVAAAVSPGGIRKSYVSH